MSDAFRTFERRIRRRLNVRMAGRRVWESLPAILQIVAAVAVSYAITHWLVGHSTPILAVTVTITSLGLTRDARPRRIAESLFGIVLGVAVADGFTLLFGHGLWQLLIVLLVVFVIGRLVWPNPAFAVAAAVPSGLVSLLPAVPGGPFGRTLDALIAALVALLATALIPRNPGRAAARDQKTVFSLFDEGLGSVVSALMDADPAAGDLGLERLRRTQPALDDWAASLDTATAVARISPFLRRQLPALQQQARVLRGVELASRHLRTVARRVEFLVRDGVKRPALAGVIGEYRAALRILNQEIGDVELTGATRSVLHDLAARLDPAVIVPGAGLTDAALVLLLRPLAVDLLTAAGMDADQARALLPRL